jgi:ribose transport system permease protein
MSLIQEAVANRRPSLAGTLERLALPLLLLVIVVVFASLSDTGETFRSSANVKNILANQSVTAILALAMIVPLVSGYFDLSVGAIAGLANVATAALMSKYGASVMVAIFGGLAIGALVGAINGLFVAALRLNALVVTLGSLILIEGLVAMYTKGTPIYGHIPESFVEWGSQQFLGVPRPFVLLLVVGLVVWYGLMHTPFGRELESIGSNEAASRLVGVPVEKRIFASFVLSGLLAGAAGVLLTSRSGNGDPSVGGNYLFAALAAVFLGSTTIRPGTYNVWGAIVGVFFVAVTVNGFTLLGAELWISDIVNGASLITAVTVVTLISRHRKAIARDRSRASDPAAPLEPNRSSAGAGGPSAGGRANDQTNERGA